MRDSYREQLDTVVNDLVEMSRLVSSAVKRATQALLTADIQLAEQVISDDAKIDSAHNDIEQRCFSLLARQAPVAGELRTVVAALRMVAEMARMGDLSAHVAKIARLRYPEKALPTNLEGNFRRMAEVADEMVNKAGNTLHSRNVEVAHELAEIDEEMDDLRRSQFRILLSDDWTHGVEAAVDVALLGRYYERIADHAVSMGRRVVYVVTGETAGDDTWTTA
ncbi:phosphate signaling complex protein PhoU [Enemella evansiae]|uniref:Phosphate-specific transport system accessory protein PhoU n=1 Tax=Enemella evansiae TaxID=2016499 RepID=A0A255G890_9ACTN|nr:phosphate signaling complex protein PhoU [Enemella evansiae]PFG66039.1 phosphate transport system protein [Propionibacteriaceae bacterium ES.041]OYN99715.1 phosphate transport system regulatory protein PhoU [Enemella evansiae]OYO00181.1 phosphate transport system regulatory protein PhoU [Enemella evansiae]OYO04664.1 phosphate transport system regulatory protein PhoU [Enemella evansiae]OYO09102.1 phosphate transport system regulatory protein PhoU [Enemella evansiae]